MGVLAAFSVHPVTTAVPRKIVAYV